MKLILVVLVTLSYLSTACRDRNDNNQAPQITPKPPSEPAAPSWAGNCDVDYSQLQTDRLEKFGIIIEDRGINREDKIVILNELNSLPDFVLEALGENKIPFRMIEGGVTEFEELSTLKGELFDASYPDYLWDDVAGLTLRDGVFMGSTTHGANSLSIHEASHAFDLTVDLSLISKKLSSIYNLYASSPHPDDPRSSYRMSTDLEFFSVGFDQYYCSKSSRYKLELMYPELFSYFQNNLEDEYKSLQASRLSFYND